MSIKFNHVSSSAIEKVAYVPYLRTLRIVFHTGKVYDYIGVSQEIYDKFINSDSIGRYYNRNIKDKIEAVSLDTEDSAFVIPHDLIEAISLFGGKTSDVVTSSKSTIAGVSTDELSVVKNGSNYQIVKKSDLITHLDVAKKANQRITVYEFGKTMIDW